MDNNEIRQFNVSTLIEDSRWLSSIPRVYELANEIKNLVIQNIELGNRWVKASGDFSINLCLSNDDVVQKLNKQFRGLDKPTNVLSFANIDDVSFESQLSTDQQVELGDVILAYETLSREAQATGVTLADHFCHLWVHGFLHILGYDHMKEEDAAKMEQLEIEVLAQAGIANPYLEEA